MLALRRGFESSLVRVPRVTAKDARQEDCLGPRRARVMIASVLQSLPVTLLVEGGIFVTLAMGLRLSRRGRTAVKE